MTLWSAVKEGGITFGVLSVKGEPCSLTSTVEKLSSPQRKEKKITLGIKKGGDDGWRR